MHMRRAHNIFTPRHDSRQNVLLAIIIVDRIVIITILRGVERAAEIVQRDPAAVLAPRAARVAAVDPVAAVLLLVVAARAGLGGPSPVTTAKDALEDAQEEGV